MKVITGNRVPIKSWCDDLDEGTLEQIKTCAELPFIHNHVAVMPDAHLGYGINIGGVIACEGIIIPNAVGVDIGCGMCVIKSDYNGDISKEILIRIMDEIRSVIPMGVGKQNLTQVSHDKMPDCDHTDVVVREYEAARYQIGSLGSGNHFIELQRDEDNYLWIMVHSGSRNMGFKIAKHYNDLADKLHKDWCIDSPKDLAWLSDTSFEGIEYLIDMNYATEFAFLSRKMMMDNIIKSINIVMEDKVSFPDLMINIHHNFARSERHYGKDVWVHRKGATSASEGEIGIIPGSQGSNSYIVEGLGNRESFKSCSHGAGRKMGRKDAQRRLVLEDEIKRLDDIGVIHSIRSQKDLDEATGAYKDIEEVISSQLDLVKVVYKLSPIAVLKG